MKETDRKFELSRREPFLVRALGTIAVLVVAPCLVLAAVVAEARES